MPVLLRLTVLVLLLVPVMAFPQAITAGLTGCWHLDETSGVSAADCSPGGTHPGSALTGTTWVTAASGHCKLNGCWGLSSAETNQYMSLGAPLTSFGTSSALTVVLSFRGTGTPVDGTAAYDLPAIWRDASFFVGLHWGTISGGGLALVAYHWDTAERRIITPYTSGTLVRVAWVHSGGVLRLYVDGVEVAGSPVAAGNTDAASDTLQLGTESLAAACTTLCIIDEVSMYNRGLTPAEIAQDAGSAPGLPGDGGRPRVLTFE